MYICKYVYVGVGYIESRGRGEMETRKEDKGGVFYL